VEVRDAPTTRSASTLSCPGGNRGNRTRRGRCIAWRLLVTLGLVFGLGVIALVLYAEAAARRAVLPPTVGNWQPVRDRIAGPPANGRYRFGVVGDTRNTGTCERVMRAFADESLQFLVILGDFVDDAYLAEHRFFTLEMSEKKTGDFPIFLVVGNHDFGKEVSLADVEGFYGPSQFTFRCGPDLFVVLAYVPNLPTRPAVAFLEKPLRRERASARRVFVLCHTPPIGVAGVSKAGDPDPSALVRVLEAYHVDYVISGDFHGYHRMERNGVRYLVTGGGGGHLDKRSGLGRFHHAIVLDVAPDRVSEGILPVSPSFWHTSEDRLERWAVVRAAPWLRRHVSWVAAGGVIWLALVVLSWRSLRRGRSTPDREQASADHGQVRS